MRGIEARSLQRLKYQGILASITALCLVLIVSVTAFAGNITISDEAGVLNQSQVQNAASSLTYPLSIYTVNNFNGSESSFDQRTASHVTSNNLIVISISTNLHHIAIKAGSSVPLSNSGASSATNAFISSYQSNSDYTSATVSSINSLESTLASSGGNSTNGNTGSSGSSFLGVGSGCLIGLVILGLLFFFVLRRNRNRGGSFFNRGPQYVDPNYGQSYPPNYGPGYPGYPQNQGMNPLAAGGLGAAAGGFLGYELGKEQGEREERRDEGNYGGNGGDFGGGFGGGASGDFGGGNGGGFGGGASGDFGGGGGGGGDFGGGGNSGGGSSGNF